MDKIELKNWTLYGEGVDKIKVTVPSDLTNDLFKEGIIEDPLFGDNLKRISDIYEKDWTYECEFGISSPVLSHEKIYLCFDGVDTLSEITLNGNVIGKTDNMFLRYEYDVKRFLKEGKNLLMVKIFSALKYVRGKDDGKNYRALFNRERLYIRKAQFHFGWDWAPKLIGTGIYLPARLEIWDGAKIDDVYVEADISGKVRITTKISGNYEGKLLRVTAGSLSLVCTIGEDKTIAEFNIESPRLWYPNGYGEQNLYRYSAELLSDGRTVDEKSGDFCFKKVELIQKPIADGRYSFYFMVNGKRIFVKGSNWVPISNMTGAIPDKSYEKYLCFAKECNYNLLRVWGGGIYEKEIFYNFCDKLGILVWQEFAFSCSIVPAEIEGIEENFLKEAEYQVKRLRNHPSLFMWCGGNENYVNFDKAKHPAAEKLVKETLADLCKNLNENSIYLYNSPSSCLGADEYSEKTGDSHQSALDVILKENAFDDFRRLIARRPAQFVSESAVLGPSRKRSLKKFMTEKDIEKPNGVWEYHFVKNPHSADCGDSFINKEKRFAENWFGKTEGVNDFLKKGMVAHSELLGAECDFARANENCGGYMNWMFNDCWGCGTWAVVDSFFEKKPAFYKMKREFAKVSVRFVQKEDGVYASVANDGEKAVCGRLNVSAKTLSGSVSEAASFSARVDENGIFVVKVDLTKNVDYLCAEFVWEAKSVKEIFFYNGWKGHSFTSDLKYSVTKKEDFIYEMKIRANEFARVVFIDYSDNAGITYSDNFFDMEKGEEKIIEIVANKAKNADKFSVKTFADEWED